MKVDFVFAKVSPGSGRVQGDNPDLVFVEVEDERGAGVSIGEWREEGGLFKLRVDVVSTGDERRYT